MRIIVLGLGAIGGTVAAALTLSGQAVVGIARGAHLQAIQANGLTLRSPEATRVARFACVATPSEINIGPSDIILLATKGQHTDLALSQLQAAGVKDQPIFCLQNGVENERRALRLFPNVHGVTVMLPAEFMTPGEVASFGTPNHGTFEIGRYPSGTDSADAALATTLTAAGITTLAMPDVMASKYGKLIMNLGNIVEAALGRDADTGQLSAILQEEGKAVLAAASIEWRDVRASDPRRDALLRIKPVLGVVRTGSSSSQSLVRGAGSIETDFLNGEIVLLGRLHGVPTPANAWFTELGDRMAREKHAPGAISRAEVDKALGL